MLDECFVMDPAAIFHSQFTRLAHYAMFMHPRQLAQVSVAIKVGSNLPFLIAAGHLSKKQSSRCWQVVPYGGRLLLLEAAHNPGALWCR